MESLYQEYNWYERCGCLEKRFSRCEGIWYPEFSKCEALESGILSVEPGILIVLNPESTDFDGIQDHFSGTREFGSRLHDLGSRIHYQDPESMGWDLESEGTWIPLHRAKRLTISRQVLTCST